jgi:hypothetical protein
MNYPVLVFGKNGPGVVRVSHPPPPVVRLPVLPRLRALVASEEFIFSDSVRVEYRTLRLQRYACLLPEHEEWAAWGDVRPIRTERCASCGLRLRDHSASVLLDCDGFRSVVEEWLFVPVYVEE